MTCANGWNIAVTLSKEWHQNDIMHYLCRVIDWKKNKKAYYNTYNKGNG